MKFNAILFTAIAGLTSTVLANPYADALAEQFSINLAKREQIRLALDARDTYEEDLYRRAIATSHIYARSSDEEDFLLDVRDLEERELEIRSTIVWTNPEMLNPKGQGAKSQAAKTLKAQYEHYIKDWAERKFGSSAYVRIQDAPHDSGNRADGRAGDARDHFTVEVVGGSAHDQKKPGKALWYHVYLQGSPIDKQL